MQKDFMNAVSLLSEEELILLTCVYVNDAIKEAKQKSIKLNPVVMNCHGSWSQVSGRSSVSLNAIQESANNLCVVLQEEIAILEEKVRKIRTSNSPETLLRDFQTTDTGRCLQRAWMALLNKNVDVLVKMVAYAENDLSIDAMKLFRSIVQASGVKVITSGSAERCPDGERDGEMIFVCDQTALKLSYHQPRGKESKPVYTIASVEGNLIEDRYIGTRFQQTSCDDQSVEAVKAISSQIVKTIRDHYVPEDTRQTVDSKFVFVNLDDLQPAAFEVYQATPCNLGDTIVVLNSAPGKRIFYQHNFVYNYVSDEKAVSPVLILPGASGRYEGQPEGTDVVNTYKPNKTGRVSIYIQEMDIASVLELPTKVVNLEVS